MNEKNIFVCGACSHGSCVLFTNFIPFDCTRDVRKADWKKYKGEKSGDFEAEKVAELYWKLKEKS